MGQIRWCGRIAAAALAASLSPGAGAQDLSFRIEVSEHEMAPLHSFVVGEVGDDLLFFTGISGQGLHSLLQGGAPGQFEPSFPVNVYSRQAHLFNPDAGERISAPIDALPDDVRLALTVSNAASVQYGETLYVYGGYGPLLDGSDWETRDTMTAIDLAAVRDAMRAGGGLPASAFTVESCPDCWVAGGAIVQLGSEGEQFALIGGSTFFGDYAGNTPFVNVYSERMHVFDSTQSMTTAIATLFDPSLHRRDMNALPVTLPADGGGAKTGYVIAGGVFFNGFSVWPWPLVYEESAGAVETRVDFEQKMNQYEGLHASFRGAAPGDNVLALFGGISSHRRESGAFVRDQAIPWVTDITLLRMTGGAFMEEQVVGHTPLPTTNTHLIYNDLIPRSPCGQVLLDELPPAEVLLGVAPAGLRAAAPAGAPATYASGQMYEIYVTAGTPGDISGDGLVGVADLGLLLAGWGSDETRLDLRLDGRVDGADLGRLLLAWSRAEGS